MNSTESDHAGAVANVRLNSVEFAASALGVSVATLRRDIRLKRIRVVRYGRRVLIPKDELLRIAEKGMQTRSQLDTNKAL